MKLLFWSWVAELGVIAKDKELARGLDAFGEPLRPIAPATRKHRKSAMTPDGRGDPSAPPLMPGRGLSRTRSLLAGKAFVDHAAFYWRFDPFTFDSWAKILTIHRRKGRDVFGLSPEGVEAVRKSCLARWMQWKRAGGVMPVELEGKRSVPPLEPTGETRPIATVGRPIGPTSVAGAGRESLAGLRPGQWTGGRTEAELKAWARQTAPADVQGRPGAAYNRLLEHTWGLPRDLAGGAVGPLSPPVVKAAMSRAIAVPTFGPSKAVAERGPGVSRRMDVSSLVGAPDDARVRAIKVLGDRVYVQALGEGYEVRVFVRGDRIEFTSMEVDPGHQGQGLGTRVLGRMIEAARRAGIKRIVLEASREYGDVGYVVWPKFGFDGPLPADILDRLPPSLRRAKRLSDLMATPEGRDWWAANGQTIPLTFDLARGSDSSATWAGYLRSRPRS